MKTVILLASLIFGFGPVVQKEKAIETDPREAIVNALHPAPKTSKQPKAMKLLPGYSHASALDFEGNTVGKISKSGGLSFEYEYSPFRHAPRDPDKGQYREYAEETLNGHRVWRGFRFDRYEVNVDLCRSPKYSFVVQFRAEVVESSRARDMLTMATSLVQNQKHDSEGCVSLN